MTYHSRNSAVKPAPNYPAGDLLASRDLSPMQTVRPRNAAENPLTQRDCDADGATYFNAANPFPAPRNHAEEIANILADHDARQARELRYRAEFELVVRFRHLAPIAPCPRPNVGISRTTSNDKFLVAFLNVTFVRRDCGIGDTNVKFTPLECG
jgi:hypothetical protein